MAAAVAHPREPFGAALLTREILARTRSYDARLVQAFEQ